MSQGDIVIIKPSRKKATWEYRDLFFQPNTRSASRRINGNTSMDWVRRSRSKPKVPPASRAFFESFCSSQRRAKRQARRRSKSVGKSTNNIFVFETRVLDETSNVVISRKIKKRAIRTPATWLWSFFQRR